MALKFFNLPKARKYNVQYRYYDPDKEESLERERRIKEELGIKTESTKQVGAGYRANIKGQFRASMVQESKTTAAAKAKSTKRLLMFILILGLIAYFIFFR